MKKIRIGDWVVGEHYHTGERLTGYYDRSCDLTGTSLELAPTRHWVMTKYGMTMLIRPKHGDQQEELETQIAATTEALAQGKAEMKQLKYQLQAAKENVEDQKTEIARLQTELKEFRLSKLK